MANSLADALIRDGLPEPLVRQRLARLTQLLDLDYKWRLHQVRDVHLSLYIYIYIYVCMYIYIHICIHVCMHM